MALVFVTVLHCVALFFPLSSCVVCSSGSIRGGLGSVHGGLGGYPWRALLYKQPSVFIYHTCCFACLWLYISFDLFIWYFKYLGTLLAPQCCCVFFFGVRRGAMMFGGSYAWNAAEWLFSIKHRCYMTRVQFYQTFNILYRTI